MSELINPWDSPPEPIIPKKENKIATFFINLIGNIVSFVLTKIIKQFFNKPEKNPFAFILLMSVAITGIVYHVIWAIKYWYITVLIALISNIVLYVRQFIKSKNKK